jgi:hypothetical protein
MIKMAATKAHREPSQLEAVAANRPKASPFSLVYLSIDLRQIQALRFGDFGIHDSLKGCG